MQGVDDQVSGQLIFPMCSKRVILRLREDEFPDISYTEIVACVKAYLVFTGCPDDEAYQGKHFWHFQPSNGKANSRFHIVIDIDKVGHSGAIQQNFPHEIYRVMKIQNEIRIVPYHRKSVRDSLLCKIRPFSDAFYAWGQDQVVDIDLNQ